MSTVLGCGAILADIGGPEEWLTGVEWRWSGAGGAIFGELFIVLKNLDLALEKN